jgi:hypothetical protein
MAETIPVHIARVFELLTVQYPEYGRELTIDQIRSQLRLYALFLRDIEPAVLEAAAVDYIANNKWFPKVSELRQCALGLITYNELSAEEAWGELKRLVHRFGSYGQYCQETGQYSVPKSEHDLINRAIEIMGWRELCAGENEVADRAHFFKIFASLIERRNRTTMLLPELRELTQALSGKPVAPQLKIGQR